MATPRVSEIIKELQQVVAKHGDIEFWTQIHHTGTQLMYGERALKVSVDHIPPDGFPPVCVLHMNA